MILGPRGMNFWVEFDVNSAQLETLLCVRPPWQPDPFMLFYDGFLTILGIFGETTCEATIGVQLTLVNLYIGGFVHSRRSQAPRFELVLTLLPTLSYLENCWSWAKVGYRGWYEYLNLSRRWPKWGNSRNKTVINAVAQRDSLKVLIVRGLL